MEKVGQDGEGVGLDERERVKRSVLLQKNVFELFQPLKSLYSSTSCNVTLVSM